MSYCVEITQLSMLLNLTELLLENSSHEAKDIFMLKIYLFIETYRYTRTQRLL